MKLLKNDFWKIDSWIQKKNFFKDPFNINKNIKKKCHNYLLLIKKLSPIVHYKEILQLKNQLKNLFINNDKFILHIGDCAEKFSSANNISTAKKYNFYKYISILLEKQIKKKILLIGRIAGQYNKPRTFLYQNVANKKYINYFGDFFNKSYVSYRSRIPDPKRMLKSFLLATRIKNYLDILQYKNKILYISKELLYLPYETACTKKYKKKYFNISTHYPWIGIKSMFLNSAHIEYVKGISNPYAIKIGKSTNINDFIFIIKDIFKKNHAEIGKISIIHRFGKKYIHELLPQYIKLIKKNNLPVLWMNDPMHGNIQYINKKKIRFLEDIIKEFNIAIKIHKYYNSTLHGIHIESGYHKYFECIDKLSEISKIQDSLVDPRINIYQTKKLIFSI